MMVVRRTLSFGVLAISGIRERYGATTYAKKKLYATKTRESITAPCIPVSKGNQRRIKKMTKGMIPLIIT